MSSEKTEIEYTTIQVKKTLAEDFRLHCRRQGYIISGRLEKIILEYLTGSVETEQRDAKK